MSCGNPPGSSGAANRSELIRRFGISESRLNPSHDYTYSQDDGRSYTRGGRAYYPPWGYVKLGVQLHDASFMDASNGWVVAYHGTYPDSVGQIIASGLKVKGGQLKPRHGNVYGDGIYCSPLTGVAKTYAGEKRIDGSETDVLIMLRVRPSGFREVAANVWLVKDEDDVICTNIIFAPH
mmetsp:Transcript_38570/g.47796  ORF Transcript_38570/g.47796 Transcript_38570/m.47796 type:complete len:179 (+) Transcript_38570:55-591(+)